MKFNLFYFILSFAVGMLFVYVFTPFPEVVVRYPRPNDFQHLRFQNGNGICMEYEMKQVSCDGTQDFIQEVEQKDTTVLQG